MPSDLARSGDCTGTPYYVCPEQIEDREPDARGDLYSLGVVFFEMLSGSLPFMGKTLADILTAHRSAPLPRLPEHLSAYQPILDHLLAKIPQDRYASAAEFLDALDALRSELTARKPSKPQRSA
jgi:serine/threonine-protein kinase PpkA